MTSVRMDVRQAFRQFARQRGFSIAAILVLTLGIGANAAVLTLANVLLFKPRPGEGADRLVGVYSRSREQPDNYRSFSYASFTDVRDARAVFEDAAALNLTTVGLRDGERTRRVFGAVVTRNFFDTLGAPVVQGRTFSVGEERPDAAVPVAVISHPLWQRLGGRSDLIGSTLTINGRSVTVIGIAARGFTGVSALLSPEIYLPIGLNTLAANGLFADDGGASLLDRRTRQLMIVGRLRPGVSEASATSALDALARDLERQHPGEERDQTMLVHPLPRVSIATAPQDDGTMVGMVFVLLLAMSLSVLVIACLNLANMLLARGSARRKEVAIRQAIGGSRGQIVRQLLAEGSLLAIGGAIGGVLCASWGTDLLMASLASVMPFSITIDTTPDVRVLGATLLVAVVATLAFGLGPALALTRTDVLADLREQSSEPAPRGRLGLFSPRHVMVVAQIALSLALLAAGGLFVRSALNAGATTPGYALERGIAASVDAGLVGAEEARGRDVYRRVLQDVRALPGVEAASIASLIAFGDVMESRGTSPAGTDPRQGRNAAGPSAQAVSLIVGHDYFRTLGVGLLRGREFSPAEEDAASGRRVAIIDEPLARTLWPGEDAIGRRVAVEPPRTSDTPVEYEIVGVVAGTRHQLVDREVRPHLYLPFGSNYRGAMHLHVRSRSADAGAISSLMAGVRDRLRVEGDRLPVLWLRTLTEHRDAGILMWTIRTGGRLFLGLGLLALLLAVLGLYAVKAYLVARRTREIAIRMAVGASERDVTWMVLREGLAVATVGMGTGLLLALGAGRLASSLLLDVSPFDPLTLGAATLLLLATVLVACYVPARRAARIAPVIAMRE